MTVWLPIERWQEQTFFRLRYKTEPGPRPVLTLQPVKTSSDPAWNPRWLEAALTHTSIIVAEGNQ